MIVSDQDLLSEFHFQASGLAADFAAQARLGIYIHVPFCPHICPYCDFVKTSRFNRNDVQAYFNGLEAQYEQLIERVSPRIQTVTLYLGGGTPSLFPPEMYEPLVRKISSRFEIEEFTVETNPFTNIEKRFLKWAELGVNRLTLGAQSLQPEILKYLGRKHSAQDILQNIESARAAGIENIQVDLIFGLRQFSIERDLCNEIRILAKHGATGVSCYLLTMENSTLFATEKTSDDEKICEEYRLICATCRELGFAHHETSNFGFRPSIHNRLYWYGLPYLGLGTGAHGLLPGTLNSPLGIRYKVGALSERLEPGDDALNFVSDECRLFDLIHDEEPRNREHVLQEMIFTLLRTDKGIPLSWLERVYPQDVLHQLFSNTSWKRACAEGSFLLTQTNVQLAEHEKIRGDSWSVFLLSILHSEQKNTLI